MQRRRAAEFRRFRDPVETDVPGSLDIHVVMANASSHKIRLIRNWFARWPRRHGHHTPTSASWINQVGRFLGWLTGNQIRRGARCSGGDLEAAINACIDAHNTDPKPFRWIESADDVPAAVQRFYQRRINGQTRCWETSGSGS